MLTNDQLNIIGDTLTPLFQYLESEVIKDVVRRIGKTLTYTRTAELQALALRDLGYSPARIRKEAMKALKATPEYRKEVARNTLKYKQEIKKLVDDIVKKAIATGDEVIAEAGNMAWIDDLRVWKSAGKSVIGRSALSQIVEAVSEQTKKELKNITRTTGFKTLSGYESLQTLYTKELDKAVIKVCSGAFTHNQVLKETVKSLAGSGLRKIDFKGGRSMQLDTAAALALRTGAHQLAGEVFKANIKESGENLVYVDRHEAARNTGTGVANHEAWQGKVYYIKPGKDYSEEAARIGQREIEDLWEKTGYSVDGAHENDPRGLYGYNCRHLLSLWFEGVSQPLPEPPKFKPVEFEGKTYDQYAITQKMRAMEREIRALKRERDALFSLGMDGTEIQSKIKAKTRTYNKFCLKTNMNPQTERLTYDSGASDITKTKAYSKYHKMIEDSMVDKTEELSDYKDKSSLIPKHRPPEKISDIDFNDATAVKKVFADFESAAVREEIETACVVTKDGVVYKCYGISDRIFPDADLGDKLIGAKMSHNHPAEKTEYSFSSADLSLFMDYKLDLLRGCDKIYTYEFTRNADEIEEQLQEWTEFENYQHCRIIDKAVKYGIGYRRWKND
ncbi:MAG: phage minor capsid protein [Butyrivibrio sp.]|nr:phage minor capsid protein [Butyrivibrio sp.]